MPDADSYITTVSERIKFWDGDVYNSQIGPLQCTVGHLYDTIAITQSERAFNIQLHFCVALAQLPSIDSPFPVEDFANRVGVHGFETSKGSPGFGTAEVSFGCLISPLVHQTAAQRADSFSVGSNSLGMRRAVVVDLSSNWVHTSLQTGFFHGRVNYAINQRVRRLFPLPAQLDANPGNVLAW